MPLYDYDCLECGRRIEVVHGVHAPGPTHCPNCGGGPLKKAIAAPAVHFKGSGGAKKERRATVAPGASKAGEGSGEGDGEGKDAERKGPKGTESTTEGSTDASARTADTKASATKTAGTGTATKTD
jgi:putative FmdB family regulatory protein